MNRSMTGLGAGSAERGQRRVSVEARSVNHRWFKLSLRTPRLLQALESEIEARAQRALRRGAVNMNILLFDPAAQARPELDAQVLKAWRDEILRCATALGCADKVETEGLLPLLSLPGVMKGREVDAETQPDNETAALVLEAVDNALRDLVQSRTREGGAMTAVLQRELDAALVLIADITPRSALVAAAARDRLLSRVRALSEGLAAGLRPDERELAREVCFAAERSDVTEELDRLHEHCKRFAALLGQPGEAGRKLDFLLQEMLREANTLGSKTPEASITHLVVELKCCFERMKEQAQNLE
ncbi:MAG: YicC family protein [Planctomycetes bacterium]|nr:YicC family protein [Planctomycetota bacterium]